MKDNCNCYLLMLSHSTETNMITTCAQERHKLELLPMQPRHLILALSSPKTNVTTLTCFLSASSAAMPSILSSVAHQWPALPAPTFTFAAGFLDPTNASTTLSQLGTLHFESLQLIS